MIGPDRQTHWENVYTTKTEKEVSWFEESPTISLDLIRSTGAGLDAPLVDIGGGASRLVDAVTAKGFNHLAVLDLSEAALRSRSGAARRVRGQSGVDCRRCRRLGAAPTL